MKVEVEVTDDGGLREAVRAGADIVMFDNVRGLELARLVRLARELRPGILLEASGRVDLESVRRVAETGVDVVSSSALTAGAPPVDLGLDFEVR
jgi:nicotinate-nucleotide pyrophosphorylase (carboxylating)